VYKLILVLLLGASAPFIIAIILLRLSYIALV
jgi:hypothetical protein